MHCALFHSNHLHFIWLQCILIWLAAVDKEGNTVLNLVGSCWPGQNLFIGSLCWLSPAWYPSIKKWKELGGNSAKQYLYPIKWSRCSGILTFNGMLSKYISHRFVHSCSMDQRIWKTSVHGQLYSMLCFALLGPNTCLKSILIDLKGKLQFSALNITAFFAVTLEDPILLKMPQNSS